MNRRHQQQGFTLVEFMISAGILSVVGAALLIFGNFCLNSYAKNIAINVAHDEARLGVYRILRDIHDALSIPQLVDEHRLEVTGYGPAAGISMQLHAGGPVEITNDAAAGSSSLYLKTRGFTPQVGQMLIVPTHRIEEIITAVGPKSSGTRQITLANPITSNVVVSGNYDEDAVDDGSPAVDTVIALFADRVGYVVVGDEMRYYPNLSSPVYQSIARGISNTVPFSTPLNETGAPFAKRVAAVNISTSHEDVSNREYFATNMFLNSWIPQRSRITIKQ